MISEDLKETIKKELPAMLREDSQFREFVLDITRSEFADKKDTQDRFYEILADLRRDREEQARRWDRNWEWAKAQDEKWREHREWAKAQDQKWKELWEWVKAQEEKWKEHQEWVKAQDQKWKEHQERAKAQDEKWREHQEWAKAQDQKWKELWEWVKTQEEKWKEQSAKWAEQDRKWHENQKILDARFNQVHEEIMAQARKFDRSIGALGARWGIQSERAFRRALAGILEENFGVEVLHINEYDDEGTVFGRPDQVELDVIITNGLLLICELKSSIDKAGMYVFERKARFYETRHNREADRLIVISPMIDPKAQKVADNLGIETFSDSTDVRSI